MVNISFKATMGTGESLWATYWRGEMIKVEKEVTVTITGEDIKIFRNTCVLARLCLEKHPTVDFDDLEIHQMGELALRVIERT